MTPTPHPTDALPLPEPFAALSDDETPAMYKRWADQIRAARREGYELAMSRISELLSNMDRGVLRMPRDLALHGEMAQVQFYGRVQMLLDRIEALAAPEQQQAGVAEVSDEQIDAVVSAYRVGDGLNAITIQRVQQIEGPDLWAVKLNGNCLNKSGEWEWEPMPSSRDEYFLARCRFASAAEARAILALKAGGVA